MDNRLHALIHLTDQAIAEAAQAVRDQEKDVHRRSECQKLIQKLKEEIAAEQRELAAEKRKSVTLTNRRNKLERDTAVWQKKLDDIISQTRSFKSHYLGRITAMDIADDAVEVDVPVVIDSQSAADCRTDRTQLLPDDLPEHECTQWTCDSELITDFREPETVPSMKIEVMKCNGHDVSAKGGKDRRGRRAAAVIKKRKWSASESDSGDAPKKRPYRRRILDADGTASKLSSEFKRECAALLNSCDSKSCDADDASDCGKVIENMDCGSLEELAVITAPRPGLTADFRCASHKFRPENIVTIPHRFNPKEFESKLNLIRSCPNLRVLCLLGIDQRLQKLAVDSLTLFECCPKIEHFILDGGLLDLAIAYQEEKPDMIRVVEIKNEKETEEEVIHLITKSTNIRSVYLTHSSVEIIEQIVPQVTCLSLCWITDNEFQSLIKCSTNSQISDLMLETVDLTMDADMIEQLAQALPQLQLVKLSGPLEHIHGLGMFRNLRHVVFDAECQNKQTIDPNFPIDMSRAFELSRQQDRMHDVVVVKLEDDEEEENLSQDNTSCQISINKFFESCGLNLVSFSITMRERFKKDFFNQLKKGCPVLQELTVLSVFEQFFDSKSLSLPSLRRLCLQFIQISDTKLIDLLDICRDLNFISIDKPRKISSACVSVLRHYGQEIFAKKQLVDETFTAVIQTEGKDEIFKRIRDERLDISFKQKAVAEISNRLRYKY